MSWLFRPAETTAFHDKAWRRADMAAWDARWHRLSSVARRFALDGLKTGPYHGGDRPVNPPTATDGATFAELLRESFVVRHLDGYLIAENAVGFVNRARSLRRYALLDPNQPSQFDRYVDQVFATFDLGNVIASLVERQTGTGRFRISGDVYELYVCRHFWPDWVADHLGTPAARSLIAAVEQAGGPVPLSHLASLVPEQHPSAVRSAYDSLVNHLALFEDLDESGELVTGLLPRVASERRRRRATRPATLTPVEPAEVGPDGGFVVPDLRAVLLEVSAARPRLKQDSSLYAKEKERFTSALDPMPAWMLQGDDAEARENRLEHALRWAFSLELAQPVKGPDQTVLLDLTAEGRVWLALGRERQYEKVYADLRDGQPSRMYPGPADASFLCCLTTSMPSGPPSLMATTPRQLRPEERQPLRDAIHRLFAQVPSGQFCDLGRFLAWAGDLSRNPLLLGRSIRDVVVRDDQRTVPPLEDHLDEAARALLRELFTHRLAALGCVQMGVDAAGHAVFARLPRLDAYFGKERELPAEEMATRVIVQPDYTVVVIGIDPGPAADLAPFCDRVRGSATQGALTFRLSRESVFRGIGGGLDPAEIPQRLRRHASNALPTNVATELTAWCSQARTVSVTTATLIRCPDAETASRVAAALGKQAERLGDLAVAFDGNLTPALRQRLLAQGVMIEATK